MAPALSPSRVQDFLRCPLLFRFRVVDRLPEPASPLAAKGTLVHAVLERLFDLPAKERTLPSAIVLLPGAYQAICERDPAIAELFATKADEEKLLAEAAELIGVYFTLENPARLEPESRELSILADLGGEDGLSLRGIIDRVDVAPGSGAIRIVDYKTGKAPSARFADEARFQLRCYALALWKTRGVIPAMLQFLYLGDGGTVLRFEPSAAELERTNARLHALWGAIERNAREGVWPAAKGPLCTWCFHKALCPDFDGTPPEAPPDTLARLGIDDKAS